MVRIAAEPFLDVTAVGLPFPGTNMNPCSRPHSARSHRRRPNADECRTSSVAPVRLGEVVSGPFSFLLFRSSSPRANNRRTVALSWS